MDLKPYQTRALERLHDFLERARLTSAAEAYRAVTADDPAASRFASPYTPLAGLPDTPYCCIRLPTGGGKTILAAHAVKAASGGPTERERPFVLWLAPTKMIAAQTLDALRRPNHPYRRAISDSFPEVPVRVLDISERRMILAQELGAAVIVVVGTYQSFNVSNTEGRLVYADDEAFETHFADVPVEASGLERNSEGDRAGKVKLSFANLLHLIRPVLILDEAHNFVTGLAGETKARLNPACVIEFTATPKPESNTIFAASARELQAAEMIKFPVLLTEHSSWQQAVAGALAQRRALADAAVAEGGRYLRPITLFQAQSDTADAEATVAKLRAHLIDNENVDAATIRVATGDVRELDDIDLFDRGCAVEHVITIQALREGWDCSFAYVLCSLANIGASGAVEQMLGRVLRQPYAERRPSEALNRAYAHVSSRNFADAANALRDRLVDLGFDAADAAAAIVETPALALPGGAVHVEPEPLALELVTAPNLGFLPPAVRELARVEEKPEGGAVLYVAAEASPDAVAELAAAVRAGSGTAARNAAKRIEQWGEMNAARRSPAARGEVFASVPLLMARVQGELELATPETLIDLAGFDLSVEPARLEPAEFSFTEASRTFSLELDGEALTVRPLAQSAELALDYAGTWTQSELARWLDRTIEHLHTPHRAFLGWCERLVGDLIERRGLPLDVLLRGKFLLRRAVEMKVRSLRAARASLGERMLFDLPGTAVVEPEHAFHFDPNIYPAASFYQGHMRFPKHYYSRPAAMNGEEAECAQAIELNPSVVRWVRNVERQPASAFWFATATDRFYPDFVAELADGRVMVIEYKGADRIGNPDTIEKDAIGRGWASRSRGRALFATVSRRPGAGPLDAQIAGLIGV
ncbi:MAG TPA: DEAD/DEAH box helicase family protein [Croceibacterium sp.]|nr:DEAD/DEAH box helicase family protein [Croceibacterium sp.]